mgnify:CR=1 FL=1
MKTKRILAAAVAALMTALLLAGCSGGKKDVEYVVLDESLSDEQYAIGFRKADQALRDEVQKTLCEMKKDGKLAEITKKWFGKDTSIVPESTPDSTATDDSLQKVKEKKVFVLGLDDSFPPMGYRDVDSGDIIGYDIDLAKEVCARMGVELKLQPIDWDYKEAELNEGNIDCIWNGMSIDDERKEKMCLSEPYMENRQVVVTLKSSGIEKVSDLKDKVVVLQKGSTAAGALDGREDVKSVIKDGAAVEVPDNVQAMYELRQGTSDAVVMDEIVARYYIAHLTELEAKSESK